MYFLLCWGNFMVLHPLFIWRCSKVLGLSMAIGNSVISVSNNFSSENFLIWEYCFLYHTKDLSSWFFKTTAIRFNFTLFFLAPFTYDFSILVTSSGLLLVLFLLFLLFHAVVRLFTWALPCFPLKAVFQLQNLFFFLLKLSAQHTHILIGFRSFKITCNYPPPLFRGLWVR